MLERVLRSYGCDEIATNVHAAVDCLSVRYFLATARASDERIHYSIEDKEGPHTGLHAKEMSGTTAWKRVGKRYVEVSDRALKALTTAKINVR